jgi:RNA polymerase sigma-70 factor (ECF subfamily)
LSPRPAPSEAEVEAVVSQTQQIWAEFGDRLRVFVARRVRDEIDAEDIVQDVFLRIHTRLDTLGDEGKLSSWVYQITRNAIADYYRGQRPATELTDSVAAPEAPPEDVARELLPGFAPMFERLTAEDRQALLLTEVDGLTQRELATRLGLSLPGAKSRVQRARHKLRQAFVDCCRVEFDRRGGVAAYQPGCEACRGEPIGGDESG